VPNSASVNDSLSSQWKASPCRQRSTNKQRARACAEGAQFGSTIAPKVDQRMRQQPTSSPLPDGRGTADEIDNSSGIGLQFNASFISSCGKNTDRIRPGRSILRSVASRDNRGIDCWKCRPPDFIYMVEPGKTQMSELETSPTPTARKQAVHFSE